jgi:hypothetical protein
MCVTSSLAAYEVELLETEMAVADKVYILAAADMVCMVLGSIGLAVVDRVAAHNLVVALAIDHAVLEAAACYLLQSSLFYRTGTKDL